MKEKEYKVFVSYSWTSKEHEMWVYNLAKRLMENDGIEVVFDKWDLKPGQDKYTFMESMVEDESIDKVLIICDEGYKSKADKRDGGVGDETQIITPNVYGKAKQTKFIPIIAQMGEKLDTYLPIYLKGRISINLAMEDTYEDEYEKLVRIITEQPEYKKPKKGKLRSYSVDEEISNSKTKILVKELKHALLNKVEKKPYIISDFSVAFYDILNEYVIDCSKFSSPYDEQIIKNINNLLGLRNDYIEFISLLSKAENEFDTDLIVRLFEELYKFTDIQKMGDSHRFQYDHFKFLIHELFLYTVIILIENNRFSELKFLLHTKYLTYQRFENIQISFERFKFYIESLDDYRKKRLNLQFLSLSAELLIERSNINGKSYKEKILEADLLLYYISALKTNDQMKMWFPETYIFLEQNNLSNFFLRRFSSARFFHKAKILFNIDTKEEMQEIIESLKNKPNQGYSYSFYNYIPNIDNFIEKKDVCSFL